MLGSTLVGHTGGLDLYKVIGMKYAYMRLIVVQIT